MPVDAAFAAMPHLAAPKRLAGTMSMRDPVEGVEYYS